MSRFTENVHISPLPKANRRVTTKPLMRYINDTLEGRFIEVPANYIFDGASVPMFLGRAIQRVEPRTINAACLHDRLYTDGRRTTRKEADSIFYWSLIASGVHTHKSWIMWAGVRLGGRLYWYKLVGKTSLSD